MLHDDFRDSIKILLGMIADNKKSIITVIDSSLVRQKRDLFLELGVFLSEGQPCLCRHLRRVNDAGPG